MSKRLPGIFQVAVWRYLMLIPLIMVAGCTGYNYEASSLAVNNVSITWLGHASFIIESNGKTIYIDPYVLPVSAKPADLILVTHEHFDHAAIDQINSIRTNETIVFGTTDVINRTHFGTPIKAGLEIDSKGVRILTVKSYNTNKYDSYGRLYHTDGVGYIIEMNGARIYHAGDTDFIEEMKSLGRVDVALLPIGGRYTMTPDEATEAAKAIKPAIFVPMHYDSERYGIQGISVNPSRMQFALAGSGIEVKILEPFVK